MEPGTVGLVTAEYSSLRNAIITSEQYLHQVLSWGLAGYTVFFVGGLQVAISTHLPHSLVRQLELLIFFLALPGYVCAMALTWLGELQRVEMAAWYIRSLELRWSEHYTGSKDFFRWESWIAGQAGTRRNKNVPAFVGPMLLFGGSLVTSLVAGLLLVNRSEGSLGPYIALAAGVLTVVIAALVVVSLHIQKVSTNPGQDVEQSRQGSGPLDESLSTRSEPQMGCQP